MVGTLEILMGPMYSEKSTETLRRLKKASLVMKVILVNHKKDTRNEEDHFSTHNTLFRNKLSDQIEMVQSDNLASVYDTLIKYDMIGIDEAQFFPDLKDIVLKLVEKENKRVIISGLDGSFQRKPMGQILSLIPFADKAKKYQAYCSRCAADKIISPAPFTKRITMDTEEELIGGMDLYIPLCRRCYLE
jgi:thymidine kinase